MNSLPLPLFVAAALTAQVFAQSSELAPGVRGIATRAPKNMKIDGDLSEFKGAFCTPVEYFSFDAKTLRNRAGQFFYLWQWPNELAAPGVFHLLGIVYDKSGKELTRVAPRMVSVNMQPGY